MQTKFNALLSGAFRGDSALEVVMRRCLADGTKFGLKFREI